MYQWVPPYEYAETSDIRTVIEELGTAESIVRDLARALQVLERVIVELYPGHVEPDAEHLDEYRAVWSAVADARELLLRVPKELKP